MRTIQYLILVCALMIGQMATAQNQQIMQIQMQSILASEFPDAPEGYERIFFYLPEKYSKTDELNSKVEIIPGKNIVVDCNRHWLNGNIEEKTVDGYGYPYYTFETNGQVSGTLMGCPEGSKKEKFVMAKSIMIPYNSLMPVVVYVPKGYTIMYRIWSAGDMTCVDTQVAEPVDMTKTLLNTKWEWTESVGGIDGKSVKLKQTGMSRAYVFKEDGKLFYEKNGKMMPSTYELSNRVSTFTKGKVPMILFKGADKQMSYTISGDTLTLSEECYDCYKHIYVANKPNRVVSKRELIRDCPDHVVENHMPMVTNPNSNVKPRSNKYYIYKGERREIEEFDQEWLKKNCDLEVHKVF